MSFFLDLLTSTINILSVLRQRFPSYKWTQLEIEYVEISIDLHICTSMHKNVLICLQSICKSVEAKS